jgi:hypothetical protein
MMTVALEDPLMSSLSTGPRLNARSTKRIHAGAARLSLILESDGLTFEGGRPGVEAIVSALVSAFLTVPYDQQKAFLKKAFVELEEETGFASRLSEKRSKK